MTPQSIPTRSSSINRIPARRLKPETLEPEVALEKAKAVAREAQASE